MNFPLITRISADWEPRATPAADFTGGNGENRGDDFLLQKDFIKARQEYHKAIKHDLFSFWPWVNLLKAILKK